MNLKQLYYATQSFIRGFYPDFLANLMTRTFIANGGFDKVIYGNIPFGEQADQMLARHLSPNQLKDRDFVNQIRFDMAKCRVLFGTQAYEYFFYGYFRATSKHRRSILSRRLKDGYCIRAIGENWKEEIDILKNKNRFYEVCKEFFGRESVRVETREDRLRFEQFLKTHSQFIAKPNRGHCGRGVVLKDSPTDKESVVDLFDSLLVGGGSIVEELVKQSDEMAIWNESSVNTVRIPSFRVKGDQYVVAWPFIRFGRKGNIVDNAGSGGVFAAVDPVSGNILSNGADEFGGHYVKHPDSGIEFKGWKIPQWQELIELSHRVHAKLPRALKYVGFDFAHTNNGWVLIEGNWGELLSQCPLGRGIRWEFAKLMHG